MSAALRFDFFFTPHPLLPRGGFYVYYTSSFFVSPSSSFLHYTQCPWIRPEQIIYTHTKAFPWISRSGKELSSLARGRVSTQRQYLLFNRNEKEARGIRCGYRYILSHTCVHNSFNFALNVYTYTYRIYSYNIMNIEDSYISEMKNEETPPLYNSSKINPCIILYTLYIEATTVYLAPRITGSRREFHRELHALTASYILLYIRASAHRVKKGEARNRDLAARRRARRGRETVKERESLKKAWCVCAHTYVRERERKALYYYSAKIGDEDEVAHRITGSQGLPCVICGARGR